MRNHKEFKFLEKNWADYWSFTLVWPQLFWGRVDDTQDYDAFLSEGRKFALEIKSGIGYYEDANLNSIWFILLGFGFCLKHQNSY